MEVSQRSRSSVLQKADHSFPAETKKLKQSSSHMYGDSTGTAVQKECDTPDHWRDREPGAQAAVKETRNKKRSV